MRVQAGIIHNDEEPVTIYSTGKCILWHYIEHNKSLTPNTRTYTLHMPLIIC